MRLVSGCAWGPGAEPGGLGLPVLAAPARRPRGQSALPSWERPFQLGAGHPDGVLCSGGAWGNSENTECPSRAAVRLNGEQFKLGK